MSGCCKIIGQISSLQQINGNITAEEKIGGSLSTGILAIKAVYQYKSKFEFPTLGEVSALYVAQDENASYRWNESDLHYYCVGRDYQEIEVINGGSSNG